MNMKNLLFFGTHRTIVVFAAIAVAIFSCGMPTTKLGLWYLVQCPNHTTTKDYVFGSLRYVLVEKAYGIANPKDTFSEHNFESPAKSWGGNRFHERRKKKRLTLQLDDSASKGGYSCGACD